jgi:hypothetical protein
MELQGRIIAALPERGGVSQRGTEWKVQEFVLETHEQYPKKMVFEVFGADRLSRFNIQIGQEVLVAFDIDAREWNGRWFNSIRAFDVRPYDATQMPSASAGTVQPAAVAPDVSVSAQPSDNAVASASPVVADDGNTEELPF